MCNSPGVMDKEKNLLSAIRIDYSSVDALKADGTISGGMIPKMETAAKVFTIYISCVHVYTLNLRSTFFQRLYLAGSGRFPLPTGEYRTVCCELSVGRHLGPSCRDNQSSPTVLTYLPIYLSIYLIYINLLLEYS